MPVAITWSNCAGTFGWVVDGCGGGVCEVRGDQAAHAVARRKGGCPVRHSYSTHANA